MCMLGAHRSGEGGVGRVVVSHHAGAEIYPGALVKTSTLNSSCKVTPSQYVFLPDLMITYIFIATLCPLLQVSFFLPPTSAEAS